MTYTAVSLTNLTGMTLMSKIHKSVVDMGLHVTRGIESRIDFQCDFEAGRRLPQITFALSMPGLIMLMLQAYIISSSKFH